MSIWRTVMCPVHWRCCYHCSAPHSSWSAAPIAVTSMNSVPGLGVSGYRTNIRPRDICYRCFLFTLTPPSAQHTAKLLVGIAPSGVVVFVSRCYPGSTTDKEIVVNSGILNKLDVGDNIMADKGFLLHDILPEGLSSVNFNCKIDHFLRFVEV